MLIRSCLKKGEGVPLVFLHGFLGTATDWEAVCSFLPSSHCIGFDLPGHGNSPFLESVQIPLERFHLIGYSMGGRIALSLAAAHPNRIASLTLISTHPGLSSEEEKKKRLEHDSQWAKLLFELSIDEFLLRWYDQSIFKPFVPDLTMRKKQNIPALAVSLLHYSLGRQVRMEPKEALILVGERDQKFRSLYSDPVVIPEAGHMVHLENPRAVAREIEKRIFS